MSIVDELKSLSPSFFNSIIIIVVVVIIVIIVIIIVVVIIVIVIVVVIVIIKLILQLHLQYIDKIYARTHTRHSQIYRTIHVEGHIEL